MTICILHKTIGRQLTVGGSCWTKCGRHVLPNYRNIEDLEGLHMLSVLIFLIFIFPENLNLEPKLVSLIDCCNV